MFTRLAGFEIKSMWPIFKAKMLIYQSKADFDEIILFGKITRLYTQQLEKCLYGICMEIENSTFHSGP